MDNIRMRNAGEVVAQTICVHGDTPGAVEMIKGIRKKLEVMNVKLQSFGKYTQLHRLL